MLEGHATPTKQVCERSHGAIAPSSPKETSNANALRITKAIRFTQSNGYMQSGIPLGTSAACSSSKLFQRALQPLRGKRASRLGRKPRARAKPFIA